MDETDPESVELDEILRMVRGGEIEKEKRQVLIDKCSMFKMGISKFEPRVLIMTEYLDFLLIIGRLTTIIN